MFKVCFLFLELDFPFGVFNRQLLCGLHLAFSFCYLLLEELFSPLQSFLAPLHNQSMTDVTFMMI